MLYIFKNTQNKDVNTVKIENEVNNVLAIIPSNKITSKLAVFLTPYLCTKMVA